MPPVLNYRFLLIFIVVELNGDRSPVRIISSGSLSDMVSDLRHAIERRKMILLVGLCRVDYRGRASSTLDYGERLVILKSDGSVQIHRPWDVNPVNWQPPDCIFHVDLVEGSYLRIRAIRRSPREIVDIVFKEVYFSSVLDLVDRGVFSLYASEHDMQRAIMISPELVEDGLRIISYEKPVEPGFIDLYGIDSKGRFVVLELKRRVADRDAVVQLSRYVELVKRKSPYREVRGILVAPDINKNALTLLKTLHLEFKRLDPRKCVEVLKKEASGVKLTDFFKKKSLD